MRILMPSGTEPETKAVSLLKYELGRVKMGFVHYDPIDASKQPTLSSATFHHARILNFAPFGRAFRTKLRTVGQEFGQSCFNQ